jgi:aquaporin Z
VTGCCFLVAHQVGWSGGVPALPPRLTDHPAPSTPMLADRIAHSNITLDPATRLARRLPASPLARQLTVEFLGTFILVLTIGLATSSKGAGDLAPLAIGSALMVMVFAGGHISGAHYNPAVSIAVLLAGKLRQRQAACYILTQLFAGVIAALVVRAMVGPATRAAVASEWRILIAEFAFTLALAYVVLNVTAATATEGNSFYGLAIGATIATGIFAVGKTSGGLFNLAAALGGGVTGALAWSHWWIYLLACLLGSAAAAVIFAYLHPPLAEGK